MRKYLVSLDEFLVVNEAWEAWASSAAFTFYSWDFAPFFEDFFAGYFLVFPDDLSMVHIFVVKAEGWRAWPNHFDFSFRVVIPEPVVFSEGSSRVHVDYDRRDCWVFQLETAD